MITVIVENNQTLNFTSLTNALTFAQDYKDFKPYATITVIKEKKVIKTF